MAKKRDEIDLSEFDLDDDLDFNIDFDPPQAPVPEGRDAILSLPKHLAKGALNAARSPGKRDEIIRNSLPKEYKAAYEAYDSLANQGNKILGTARDEYRKTKQELKRTGRDVLPAIKNFMPKKLYDKLLESTKEHKYQEFDARLAEIEGTTANIFDQVKSQNQQPDRRMVDAVLQERAEKELREQSNDIKLNRLVDLVQGIGHDTGQVVGYQNTVTTDYRRKMLELTYRQYFAMTDLVEVTKSTAERSTAALETIVHNTALPDYAKEEFGEITGALLKRRIAEAISPANLFKDYINKVGENIQSKVKGIFGGTRDAIGAASTMAMMGGLTGDDDSQLSPGQKRTKAMQGGAEIAGGFIFDKLTKKWIKKGTDKFRDYLGQDNAVANTVRKGAYNLMNLPQILNTYAKNPYYDGAEAGVMGPMANLLGDILPQFHGPKASLSDRGVGVGSKPAPWTSRNDMSINEIIPGWLAKINQSIRVLSGNESPLEQYDPETRSYINTKEISGRIRKTVNAEQSRKWIRQRGNEIVDSLDPQKVLSEDERKILQRVIDEKTRKGEKFDIRDLANGFDGYGQAGNGKDLSNLQSHFSKITQDEANLYKLNISASNGMNRMRSEMGYTQQYIDEMVDRYGEDALVRANVFVREGDRLVPNKDLYDQYSSVKGNARKDPNAKGNIHSTLNAFIQNGFDPSKFPPANPNGLQQQLKLTEDTVRNGVRAAFFTDELPDLVSILNKAKSDTTQVDRDDTLTPLVTKIHEQLIANNLSAEVEHILSILELIAQQQALGGGGPGGPGGGGGPLPNGADTLWGHAKRLTGLGLAGLRRGGKALNSTAKKARDNFRNSIGRLWRATNPLGVARSLFDTAGKSVKALGQGLLGQFDIYSAEGQLLLTAAKLKAGEYYNARGEVIKSIKDIVGAVYDASGNVIISADELSTKLKGLKYHTAKGWQRLIVGISGLMGTSINRSLKMPKTGLQFLQQIASSVTGHVVANQDIYVKGERTPRLYHTLMVRGQYISQKTGKLIRTIKDIDGPVINPQGEVVISAEEMAKPDFQLVDVKGVASRTNFKILADGVAKTARAAWGLAKLPLKAMLKGGAFARDVLMSGGEWFAKLVSGKVDFSVSFGTSKVVDRLDQIYKLLDDRLKDTNIDAKERSLAGDDDGDGERDNSFRAIFKRRREARKAAADAKSGTAGVAGDGKDKKGKGLFGLLGMLGGGLMTVFGGISKTMGRIFIDVIGKGLGAVFTKVLFPIFKAGGELLGNAFTKVLGPLAKGLGAGAAALGRGALVAGGAVAKGAGRAIAWTARNVLWNGARAVGMAAIGAVSAPVAIGAGIIAGVTALGYGAYKLSQRKFNTVLDQIRFAYYGTEEYERGDNDDAAKIRYLENEFGKFTTWDGQGIAALKGMSREIILKIAEGVEIPVNDEETKTMFERWILGRFIPVYLLWSTRVRQVLNGGTLESVAKEQFLTPKERMKFIEKIELPKDHPIYNVALGPFEDEDLMTADDVESMTKDIKDDLKRLVAAQITPDDAKKIKESGGQPLFMQSDFGKTPAMTNLMGGTAVKPKAPEQKAVDTNSVMSQTGPNSLDQANPTMTTVKTGGLKMGRHVDNIVNALDSIRLKTYGLTTLTEDRLRPIYELEEAVYPFIVKENAAYKFKGDLQRISNDFQSKFGYPPAANTVDAPPTEFTLWLTSRFIPTLVQYIMLVRTLVPNANPFGLVISSATGGLYDIGIGTRDTKYEADKDFITVWSVPSRPFADMPSPNNDPRSCDGNIDYLLRLRKEFELKQQTSSEDSNKVVLINDLNKATDTSKRGMGSNGSFGTDLGRSVMGDKRYDGSSQGGGYSGATEGAAESVNMGGYVDSPVGERGEGGYYDIRAKDKSKASMVEVIKQVAKLTGVDEGLLLSVAMAESSLDPNAGAKTSSAKGLFQFLYGKPNSTWQLMINKYANEFGIPANASPMDPVANSILGAMYIKESIESAKSVNGGKGVTPADIYLGHFLGSGGQRKFLKNLYANPNRIAAADFGGFAPKTPSGANRSIFAAGKGGEGEPRTYAQVYNLMQKKMRNNNSMIADLGGSTLSTATGSTPATGDTATAGAPTDKGLDKAPSNATVSNAVTAKAATDAKAGVKAANVNDTVQPSGNTAVDDKPYVNNAVSQAQKVAAGTADANTMRQTNRDVQTQIEVEKARVGAKADSTVKQVAANQYQQAVSADNYLLDQCKSLRSIHQVLTEISAKIAPGGLSPQAAFAGQGSAAPAAPANYVVKHDRAPIDVSRIKS